MKGKNHFLSVIVPAYKQEKTIKEDLLNIAATLKQIRYDYEIICVVDGWVDKTWEEAKRAEGERIKVVGYRENRGKGYAVRYGMARSRGDLVAFIDAGMDINPNGISMILEHMEWYGADIVVGSKRHPASRVPSYPFLRRLYSFGYQLIVGALFGLNLRDTQTGLKIFKRKVLEDVLPRLMVKKHAFDIEMLSVARHLGYRRIFEAPIELDPQKFVFSSTVSWRVARDMLIDTLAVFYRLKIMHYYDTVNHHRWNHDPELIVKLG